MKKLFYLFILVIAFSFFTTPIFATETPIYDSSYNDGAGAFYSNGTNITIDVNSENETLITWDTGSQIVPPSVTVFGGGSNGTNFNNSNIIMNNGIVQNLIAGGVSTSESNISTVTNANITLNGGTIKNNIAGGGYAYSQVTNSKILITNGSVNSIVGGGFSSVTINGVNYVVGTADAPQNSLNRVDNVDIKINNITIPYSSTSFGTIFGGGQGYSYVKNSKLIINEGDLSKTYITAGGSNGYTEKSYIEINGGTIKVFQSVNRGIVKNSQTKVTNGTIKNFYVGGETR